MEIVVYTEMKITVVSDMYGMAGAVFSTHQFAHREQPGTHQPNLASHHLALQVTTFHLRLHPHLRHASLFPRNVFRPLSGMAANAQSPLAVHQEHIHRVVPACLILHAKTLISGIISI